MTRRAVLPALMWLATGAAALSAQDGASGSAGRLSRAGIARAQAVVDSVFLDRKAPDGTIAAGDWASYLMARLGVAEMPDSTAILVEADSEHITFSGRIRDLPAEAQAMLGAVAALVDPETVLSADIVLLPAAHGIAHFQLRGVKVGPIPIPEIVLYGVLLDVGRKYPALTETGRDLFVQIPPDGKVTLIPGAVRLSAPPSTPSPARP